MAAAAAAAAIHLSSDSRNLPRHRLPSIPNCIFWGPNDSILRLTFSSRYSALSFHAPNASPSPLPTLSKPLTSSDLKAPLQTGRFLSNDEHERLGFLQNFEYFEELQSGSFRVRVMRAEEMGIVADLLAESFAQSMIVTGGYFSLLRFFVKQYLMGKFSVMPHSATLIGFYREKGGGGEEKELLAGTVEIAFDKRGATASPPTPTPPKNSPYICNMSVKSTLRRRGIGWHLLRASEEVICQITSSREVYLHCRMIDEAPFNMYKKAGYCIVKTDNILILFMLQRRKHLMCKRLPIFNCTSEMNNLASNDQVSL